MHDESLWLEIAWLCLLISLMAIGGANAMVPEIHRYVIEQRGWMRGDEFAALFAIAQASPGPNVLFITLIGWKVAGWPGAVASTVAMCGPSSTLALAAGRTMARNPQSRWRRVIKSGLAPLTIGLILAAGWVLTRNTVHSLLAASLCALAVVASLHGRINPVWLIALGAAAGGIWG